MLLDRGKAKSIGALWAKASAKGDWISGSVELPDGSILKLVVFKNNYKTEDKHPDWKIYLSKPKDGGAWPTKADIESSAPESEETPF